METVFLKNLITLKIIIILIIKISKYLLIIHKLGTLNSTINTIYRFISKKFNVFSQFLYDDHIQSLLLI